MYIYIICRIDSQYIGMIFATSMSQLEVVFFQCFTADIQQRLCWRMWITCARKKRPDDSTTGSDLVRSLLAMFKKLVRWVEFK